METKEIFIRLLDEVNNLNSKVTFDDIDKMTSDELDLFFDVLNVERKLLDYYNNVLQIENKKRQ